MREFDMGWQLPSNVGMRGIKKAFESVNEEEEWVT